MSTSSVLKLSVLGLVSMSGWSNQSQNVQVLRTGSGHNNHAYGSEPLLSSPTPVRQSVGIWRVVARKMQVCWLGPFHLFWPEPVLLG